MDEKIFITLIGMLAQAGFKGEKVPLIRRGESGAIELTATGSLWYTCMCSSDPGILKAAIALVVANEEFFPALATVNKYYKQLTVDVREVDGSEAWAKVEKELCRVGWNAPDFPNEPDRDILLQAVQACGGWRSIGMVDDKDAGVLRAQFRDAYNSIKKRNKRTEQYAQLGITQARSGMVSIADMLSKKDAQEA